MLKLDNLRSSLFTIKSCNREVCKKKIWWVWNVDGKNLPRGITVGITRQASWYQQWPSWQIFVSTLHTLEWDINSFYQLCAYHKQSVLWYLLSSLSAGHLLVTIIQIAPRIFLVNGTFWGETTLLFSFCLTSR